MGVDSGLPEFRGQGGFWPAYPALQQRGLSFEDMANPTRFAEHPELAWGFYDHRLKLYRATVPHEGFAILRRWATSTFFGCPRSEETRGKDFHRLSVKRTQSQHRGSLLRARVSWIAVSMPIGREEPKEVRSGDSRRWSMASSANGRFGRTYRKATGAPDEESPSGCAVLRG
jgi:hypothetical protein